MQSNSAISASPQSVHRISLYPLQWKNAWPTAVPKVSGPSFEPEFWPILITPIICLIPVPEKQIVRCFFYPFLTHPQQIRIYFDQYAFRPTGSNTAGLIVLTHNLSELLNCYQYIRLIALNFSKAFDTIRHAYLVTTLAKLPIPDNVYNWIITFLDGHQHCAKFLGMVSNTLTLTPVLYKDLAFDPWISLLQYPALDQPTLLNRVLKYADYCYLLINSASVPLELEHVSQWAAEGNLKLNQRN